MKGVDMKKWLNGARKSWVIWFNTLGFTLVELVTYAHDSFQELQPYVPADLYKWLGLVLVLGNLVLRFKTNKSLAEK